MVAVPAFGQGQPVEPQWMQALEAHSQELNRQHGLGAYSGTVTSTIDGRERAFAANDDRFRIDPTSYPTHVTAASSDTEIGWSRLGIGFVVGIALMLGLYLVVTREREPAL